MADSKENPYHQRHIEDFHNYTLTTVQAAISEIIAALPALIHEEIIKELSKNDVKIKVDEASEKTARKKIEDLLSSIGRWFH